MSTWLGRQRKPELVTLAEQAGLGNLERMKKDELVTALDDHLQTNATRLSRKEEFQNYYQRTGSPMKRDAGASAAMNSDGEIRSVVRARGRRATTVKQETDDDRSPSSPAAASTATVRTPAHPRMSSSVAHRSLPASPAAVTDAIELQEARISAGFNDLLTSTNIESFLQELRESLSSVVGVEMTVLLLESYFLQRRIMPWRYAFDLPASSLLHLSSRAVYLPDFFILLTSFYWSTFLLWTTISFWIPLVASWFWNLTLRSRTRHGATVLIPKSRCDPMTFNVVKALTTWLVFSQGNKLSGLFAEETIDRVLLAMPGGYTGLLIGAFIGILASLYDAALKK